MSQAEIFRDIGRRMRYRTLATAAANKTYAQQLAQIKPVWDELTLDEKMRCIVTIDNTNKVVFTPMAAAASWFSYAQCASNNAYITSLIIDSKTVYSWTCSTSSVHDDSSTNNMATLSLMLLE